MTVLITLAIILLVLMLLGPIGMAIIAGAAMLVWLAIQAALYLGALLLGAIAFLAMLIFDRDAAMIAWRAGRRG